MNASSTWSAEEFQEAQCVTATVYFWDVIRNSLSDEVGSTVWGFEIVWYPVGTVYNTEGPLVFQTLVLFSSRNTSQQWIYFSDS
jgi:hypothetical protein